MFSYNSGMFRRFFDEKLFEDSARGGNRVDKINKWINWRTLFVLSIITWALDLLYYGGPVFSPDSPSYINAWDVIVSGNVDLTRTPGYPLVIGICKGVFGDFGLYMVVAIQELLFLTSVVLFRDMCRMVVPSRLAGVILTVFFLFLPVLVFFNHATRISTSSVAFSSVMILLWCSVRALRSPSVKQVIIMTVLLVWCIAVRPGYIYFLPFYFLFWIVASRKNFKQYWRIALLGCLGVLIVTGCVISYQRAIIKKYGFEGLTSVTYFNNYFFARENDLLIPDYVEDDSLRHQLTQMLQMPAREHWMIWKEISLLEKNDSNFVEMNRVVNSSLLSQPDRCASALLRRSAKVGSFPMVECYELFRINQLYQVFMPRLSCVYLFMLLVGCVLMWLWIRKSRFAVVSWFLWAFIVSSHIVAIAGAQDEWGRLSQQSLPALLLLVGEVASLFKFSNMRKLESSFN